MRRGRGRCRGLRGGVATRCMGIRPAAAATGYPVEPPSGRFGRAV